MGGIKLLISVVMLFIFVTKGGMSISDDCVWFGLCMLFSAFILHDSQTITLTNGDNEDE